jgi:UDP-glucuronate 4-epimerase
MKIFITGAAGFIASHLSKKLLLSNEVIGIDNFDPFYDRSIKQVNIDRLSSEKNFVFYEGDIRNRSLLIQLFQEHKPELVIHLAAKAGVRPSMDNPVEYCSTNIEGTTVLLEAMRAKGIYNIIFGSSSSVYGENTPVPFQEKATLDSIISMYALTKKNGEELMRLYHDMYDFSVICLRFFTVYGEGQRPDLAIHKFVKSILNDEPIAVFGDGSTGRDYTYVQDIVSGIGAAVDYLNNNKPIFEIINLGNSNPVLLSDLINRLETILDKKAIKIFKEMPIGDVPITFANISKAKNLLGYQPKVSLNQGLVAFCNWFKKQGND